VPDAGAGWSIVDRYLEGSHLRLRRMDALDGGETVFKLGKKEAPDAPDFGRTVMTTIYLTAAEHSLLAPLPAAELCKRRLHVETGSHTFGVDLPDWIVREVTREERFTGGALAWLSDEERRELVRSLGSRP
jgi:hypothetical protein